METILDMTKWFLAYVCFCLLLTDDAWDNIVLLCSGRVIAFVYLFGKMALVTFIMDAFYLLFSAMYNALLHTSGHYPADKIE